MPLPERYARKVSEVKGIWSPEGNFHAQTTIWVAQSETRNELYGEPTAEQVEQIRGAVILSPEEIDELSEPKGHETNKLLRKVQSKLPKDTANFVHLGNTSSDILDTSLALQIIESLEVVDNDFQGLQESLKNLALEHRETLQIGRSHGQHAVPQTFGRQVVGWYEEIKRGVERIDRSKKKIAYGKLSGEIGTNVFIAPELEERTLEKLGLQPDPAPTQIISRDRHAEVISLMAVNGVSLARIAENIRLLALTDVGEVREPFESDQQGSSAMPHKRNPELSERVKGLSRRIRSGAAEELDSAIVWLERDISHSSTERYVFEDVFGNLSYAARLTKQVIDGLVVNSDKMLANMNTTYGAIYSPRLLNALMESGRFSRTDAYDLVKGLAQNAMDHRINLRELAGGNDTIMSTLSPEELDNLFDPNFYLKNIDVAYKRSGLIQ